MKSPVTESPARQPAAERPERAVCVDLDAAGARARWGEALGGSDAMPCLLARGPAEPEGAALAWRAPTTEGFEGRPDPASDPLLVERLRRTLSEEQATVVYGPGNPAGGELELRALGAALRAAVAALPGVRLLEPPGEASDGPSDGRSGVEPALDDLVRAPAEGPAATAVICTWNKCADVCANVEALRGQTRPFASIVVVDNASSDDTAETLARDFPDVRLVVMPHSDYGACETFNIGFASATTEWTVILDDDVVLPPAWLERATERFLAEPETTAVLSSKIVEPGMPESYKDSPEVNRERYMSTFRGCASLARSAALAEAGGYDERLYIYGNERDLTCRLLNLGYRVLQYPGIAAFHKTPFGLQMGKRSLYYHARNAWLGMLKYAPLADLLRMPFLIVTRVLLRGRAAEERGEVTDATGTIGLGRSLRETPGAWWVLVRAGFSVLANVPYCIKHRQPVRSDDFELPIS